MSADTNKQLINDIQEKIKANNIDSIRIEYPDLYGICRNKLIPAIRLEEMVEEGTNFSQCIYCCNLSNEMAPNTGCGSEIEWKDMTIFPDLNTFVILPYIEGTARLIGNAFRDGKPIEVDPRFVLQRILKKYEEKGLLPITASELEFFIYNNLNENGPGELYNPNRGCAYQINPTFDRMGLLRNMQNILLQLGIEIIYLNHEYYPSQFEVNFKHNQALKTADQTFTFKYACKEVAALNDMFLTFMGRPTTDGGGSGCHVHLSLNDLDTNKNLFDDPDGEHGMSDLMRHFIGGQLAHASGMSAFLSPTINSYKRYQPDSWAPQYQTWAMDNRTAYCRVPEERGQATRVENRAPCASSNPYLVFAATLAAGLDGIENKIDPGKYAVGDIDASKPGTYKKVPLCLEDALDELKADKVMCDAMGPGLIKAFIALKEDELARFRKHVTDWEFKEYSFQL